MSKGNLKNTLIHGFFEVTVLCKGVSGIIEICSGLLLLWSGPQTLSKFILWLVNHEAAIWGFAGEFLAYHGDNLSHGTHYFIAFYLLFYGVVNMFLVVSLLLKKLWAYPTAMIFFTLFTVYMFLRFLNNGSATLFLFAVYDVFLIALTWLEYRRIKKSFQQIA